MPDVPVLNKAGRESTGSQWKGASLKGFAALLALLVLAVAVVVITYEWVHAEHIYPGVATRDGTSLASLTHQEASTLLAGRAELYSDRELRLRYRQDERSASAKDLGVRSNGEQVSRTAYSVGRQGNLLQQLTDQLDALRFGRVVQLPVDRVYDAKDNLISTVDLKFKNISTVDLKFKNITPYPILVEAEAAGGKLKFSLYSTKPQWEVQVDPPRIEDVVKADPTVVREVDPSLPPGKEVWIEAAEDGFKSTIVRTVLESGKEPRVLRLVSTYQPSRNVVLVGPSVDERPALESGGSPRSNSQVKVRWRSA